MASSDRAFSDYTVPDSLKRFEAPKIEYMTTEAKKEIHTTLQDGQSKAIHIHGMPGCGKSQIVAAICQEMAERGYIVWQVHCQQYQNNVALGWRELGDRLEKAELITQWELHTMNSALEIPTSETMNLFLKVIDRVRFPVLLVIEFEDVDDITSLMDDVRILKLLVEAFSTNQKLQVLIASRNEDIIFPTGEARNDRLYTRREVRGFTEKEAKSFLAHENIEYTEESIITLAKELAYSPLGLLMAKNYCLEFHVSYDEYFKSLGNDELIIKKEKELMNKHPDLGQNHRYEIVMKLLKPSGTNDAEMKEFQVMKMMSFLNKNNIPIQIFESFFKHIEYMKPSEITILTKHLTRKLEKRVGCTRDEIGLISVHGDILRVLQASMIPEEKIKILLDVLFSFASMLSKDNRRRQDYGFLYNLKNHILQVSVYCSNHLQHVSNEAVPSQIQYEILLSLSRIHELVGFVISGHPGMRRSNEEDLHFEKAMEYLWGIVAMQTDKSILETLIDRIRGILVKHKRSLIAYELDKDPKKSAGDAYKLCRDRTRNNNLLRQALKNDYHRNFPVNQSDLSIMKKLGNDSGIHWDILETELENKGVLSEENSNKLIENKFILDWKNMSQFYIVERMVSVLHSRGRQDNYKRDLLDNEMIEKCKWWVEFGCQLCVKVTKHARCNTMFDYILKANNKLSKLCASRKDESDVEFQQRIREVREMTITLQNDDRTFYEHGKIRIVSNTPFTILNLSKCLIKVNTKVHKRPHLLNEYPLDKADDEAGHAYELAISNPTVVIGSTCLVHIGKYFAARKNFPRALEAFEKAFQLGIEEDADKNPTRFAWTLYNMLRMLAAAGEKYYDERTKRNIERRYDMTKTNGTPTEWVERLERLANIIAGAPTSDVPTVTAHIGEDVTKQPSSDRPIIP